MGLLQVDRMRYQQPCRDALHWNYRPLLAAGHLRLM